MTSFTEVVPRLSGLFTARADDARATSMAAYMRGQFAFLGIPTPERRQLQRTALMGLSTPDEAELTFVLIELWRCNEREYQYAAADTASRWVRVCGPSSLPLFGQLITDKSWWDTVDALATHAVGPLIAAYPELAHEMDRWVDDDNMWLRRAAILHQLTFKASTDIDRLFGYCLRRAHEREFFIRKAIGWALREYSKTDEVAVREFVSAHEAELSPLSKREALLWLSRRDTED